ncbi:MAG TPA: HAD family phosphatase [Candidatus Acidoferrales bacterium]|nr:HAD family phosphatase [Candidatus Acidoferrales bacterium]
MNAWVIFDLDGTLIESEQVWRDVRRAFVLTHGGRWHDGAQSTMIGMRTTEWARYIHDDLGVPLAPEEIARDVALLVAQRLREDIPVLPGAQRVLERLALSYPLAIATSASRIVAETVLAKTGWERYFRVVVSADEVTRGKPAPDVYLRALEIAHADPRVSAAVEDSTNGILSARAAGLAVIAVPNREFPPTPGALASASEIVANLDAIDAALVERAIARGSSSAG